MFRTMLVFGAWIVGLGGIVVGNAGAAENAPKSDSASAASFVSPADFFPIVTWDRQDAWRKLHPSPEPALQTAADCRFTVAGFVRPEDLVICEKLGLMAIVAPSEASDPWFRQWKTLSDEAIDQGIRKMVEKAGSSKAVLGYAIMDEPGTQAFPKLARAVAAVKKYAPGKLAHINLYPSYATLGAPDTSQLGAASYTEYLERFVAEVKPQFLCYDNYMVEFSDDLQDRRKTAQYFTNLLEVRRVAQKHGLPFWNVVSCNQIRKFTPIPSPANLALQAYTTLAAGGRGVTWFKYLQGGYAYAPLDNSGRTTETWQYLRLVNEQLRTLGPIVNRLTSTGVYFTSPPDPSLAGLPGKVVQQVQSKSSLRETTKTEPAVMVGEFTDAEGTAYILVVNLSLERSMNVKLQTVRPYRTQQVFSAVDGRLVPLDETNGQWLAAGNGVLIKLQ